MDDVGILVGIKNCCFAIESEKVTERKKNAEQLNSLLDNPNIVQALDDNTDSENNEQLFSWNSVFRSVRIYFFKEAAKLQKDSSTERSHSALATSARNNVKRNCIWFLVAVVQKANRDVARLNHTAIIEHVSKVSSDAYLWETFGAQHIEMVVNHFLMFCGYWKNITMEEWIELLKIGTKMFANPPSQFDEFTRAQCLYLTVLRSTQQSNVTSWMKRKFDFFESILKKHMLEPSAQEPLLRAILTFCKEMVMDYRGSVCRLGEENCASLLRIYSGRQEKKDLILEFLHLQVMAHHPGGVHKMERAAYAHDWEQWQDLLKKIYKLMETNINQMASCIRHSKNGNCQLGNMFLQLAVDVAKQVFREECELLQTVHDTSRHSFSSVNTPKRRRITSGISGIVETVQDDMTNLGCVPWLQYMTAVMEKYPQVIPEVEYFSLLQLLANMVTTCNNMTIVEAAFSCAASLVKVEMMRKEKNLPTSTSSTHWNQILEVTMRMIALGHKEEVVHRLFQKLVESRLDSNPSAYLRLILQGVLKLNRWTLTSLSVLMQKCIFPNHLPQWIDMCQTTSAGAEKSTLNVQLLDWLLPDMGGDDTSVLLMQKTFPPMVFGSVLASLVVAHSEKVALQLEKCRGMFGNKQRNLTDIENFCMKSSFQELFEVSAEEIVLNDMTPMKEDEKMLCKVDEIALKRLNDLISRHVDVVRTVCQGRNDGLVKDFEGVIYLKSEVNLLLHLTSALLTFGVAEQELFKNISNLTENLMNDISKLCTPLLGRNFRTNAAEAYIVVLALKNLFSQCYLHDQVIDLLKSKTVPSLLDLLYSTALALFEERHHDGDERMRSIEKFNTSSSAMKLLQSMSFDMDEADEATASPFALDCKNDKNTIIPTEAAIVFCRFCCISGNLGLTDKWQKCLKSLLTSHHFDAEKSSHAYMGVKLVQEIVDCQFVAEDYHSAILSVMQNLCRYWYGDCEVAQIILSLLKDCYCHLAKNGSQESRRNSVTLLKAFRNIVHEENNCSPLVLQKFLSCVAELTKVDPTYCWAKWEVSGGLVPVGEEILSFLTHENYRVSLTASVLLPSLFARGVGGQSHQNCLAWQKQLFKKFYGLLQDIFEVEETLNNTLMADEGVNRTSVVLHGLGPIIVVSPYYSTKVLFALCELCHDKEIHINLMQWILQQAQNCFHLNKPGELMRLHVNFLISQWLKCDYKLKDFPWQLLHFKSQREFFAHFRTQLTAKTYMKEKKECLKYLTSVLLLEDKDLIKESYPVIVSNCIPYLAMDAQDVEPNKLPKIHAANRTVDQLEAILGKDVCISLMSTELHPLLIKILQSVYDPTIPQKMCGLPDTLPDLEPPSFSSVVVKRSFEYLSEVSKSKLPLVSCLSKDSPSTIQKVLLDLTTAIHNSATWWEQLHHLQHYDLFVEILQVEFEESKGKLVPFMTRDIIHTYLRLLKMSVSSRPVISTAACFCLAKFCKIVLDCCRHEFRKHLPAIVTVLIMAVEKGGQLEKSALDLLKFLLLEKKDVLADAIIVLEPLPAVKPFLEMAKAQQELKLAKGKLKLKDEIQDFVNGVEKFGVCRIEALSYLCNQLHTQKEELTSMCSEMQQTRWFSEECIENPLHTLVFTLLRLVSDSSPEISEEAAKCLGELGPIDLATLVLRVPTGLVEMRVDNLKQCETNYLTYLIKWTIKYLVADEIDVVQAASHVLKGVLSTREGYEIISSTAADSLQLEYLEPFRLEKKIFNSVELYIGEEMFSEMIGNDLLWIPLMPCSHKDWITSLASTILNCIAPENHFIKQFLPLVKKKPEFCEALIPFLFFSVLSTGSTVVQGVLSEQVNRFFMKHWEWSLKAIQANLGKSSDDSIFLQIPSVRTLLKVVELLRQLPIPENLTTRFPSTPWDNNFWLNLNYLHLAKAALFCSNHFSSVLYAEIWCGQQNSGEEQTCDTESVSCSTQSSLLEVLGDAVPDEAHHAQSILLEAYCNMGEPDAVYGCGSSQLKNLGNRIRQFEVEGQWYRALSSYDLMMGKEHSGQERGLMQSLSMAGLYHLLNSVVELEQRRLGSDKKGTLEEFQFECKWRLGQWDFDSNQVEYVDNSCAPCTYHEEIYHSLQALHSDSLTDCRKKISRARQGLLLQMKEFSMESSEILYPILARLQTLQNVEKFVDSVQEGKLFEVAKELVRLWDIEKTCITDFRHQELITAVRIAALKEVSGICSFDLKKGLLELLTKVKLNLVAAARTAGWFQVAERELWNLKTQLPEYDISLVQQCKLEESLLAWKRGDHDWGRHLMKRLLAEMDTEEGIPGNIGGKAQEKSSSLLPTALELYGKWLWESKAESPSEILNKYLLRAVDLRSSISSSHVSLASYADSQHQAILDYMKSGTFEAKLELANQVQKDAQKLKAQSSGNNDEKIAIITLTKQGDLDKAEISNMKEEQKKYLKLAVEHYFKGLAEDHEHDLLIFRIVALWFHDDVGSFELIADDLKSGLPRIASYKFVPLLYQMAARLNMGKKLDKFQSLLTELLMRCAKEHPHHALPVIMALAHSHADSRQQKSKGRRSGTGKAEEEEGRVVAAQLLLQNMKKNDFAKLVSKMESLFLALIALANVPVDRNTKVGKVLNIPNDSKLRNMKDMEEVAIPTVSIPVSPTGNYNSIVGVCRFSDKFSFVGGINAPKRITCTGTDGISRAQLLKGRDDLRQDAVMQQVFTVMNRLLKQNKKTWHRKLLIRTYKVVPLSQRSGVIEWCENTQSLGEYLIGSEGKSGAHKRYRPSDLLAIECRKKIHDASNKSNEVKLKVFQNVCQRFQPVFHNFFLENFLLPGTWFEHRLAYTRSVATSSIVGYFLGLGDRHVQNILVDKLTAEVIHIDFGIAFEQGRILPTPETVPFRLTRDIVDGMGVSGVEGVFRRSCELTLEVLRKHQLVLLTIVEVLLHDPLYSWSLTPAKACKLQRCQELDQSVSFSVGDTGSTSRMMDRGGNKMAERVLLRLQQKLQGMENGAATTVTGQVNLLLQTATDVTNLSRLYTGWQAYI